MRSKFFIIIQPGLEEALVSELQAKYPQVKDFEVIKGGLQIECEPSLGYSFNHYLKSPTRVLERLKDFSCRDLPKLFQIASKIPWNDYLVGGEFELDVTCSGSRLNNEKRVEKAVEDGIRTYLKGFQPKKVDSPYRHKIFVRIHKDRCQLSIDTSGEPLYKRSAKSIVSGSLRESIAYSLLQLLLKTTTGPIALVDPMCGSGTFALEALSWQSFREDFAYQRFSKWPSMQQESVFQPELMELQVQEVILNDIDTKTLEVAKSNLKKFENVSFFNQDIKDFLQTQKSTSIVICNLPYGKQVEASSKEIIGWADLVQSRFKRWGLLTSKALRLKGAKSIAFRNGGIPVFFYYKL